MVPGIKSESSSRRESANWGQKRRSTKDLPLPQMLARVFPPFSFNSTEINYEHYNHICSTHKNVKTWSEWEIQTLGTTYLVCSSHPLFISHMFTSFTFSESQFLLLQIDDNTICWVRQSRSKDIPNGSNHFFH